MSSDALTYFIDPASEQLLGVIFKFTLLSYALITVKVYPLFAASFKLNFRTRNFQNFWYGARRLFFSVFKRISFSLIGENIYLMA